MLGRKGRDQLELFVAGSLDQLVPEDHVLARVHRVLDLGWLREEVADCYCADNGRPGIDPEVAVRLMLAGLLLGILWAIWASRAVEKPPLCAHHAHTLRTDFRTTAA